MKKRRKILIVGILLINLIGIVGCTNKEKDIKRYSSTDNKDTIASFGDDGRFCIVDISKAAYLIDETKHPIIDKVKYYKEIEPCVYTIGDKGYIKLNYENGKIKESKDIKDFSKEDQKIFEETKTKEYSLEKFYKE